MIASIASLVPLMPTASTLRFAPSNASSAPSAIESFAARTPAMFGCDCSRFSVTVQRRQPLIVGRLRRQQLDAGKLRQRLLESAQTLRARQHAAHALENDDAAGAVHLLEQIPRRRQPHAVVVEPTNVTTWPFSTRSVTFTTGIFAAFILSTPGRDGLEVHGHEDNRVRPLRDHVFDLAHLIRDAVGPRRHVMRHARVHLLRGVVGAHAQHRESTDWSDSW